MKKTILIGILMAMSLTALAMTNSAAEQLQKRINFSINAPFALRMGDYVLPPGQYVLYQVSQNDLNLFALHPKDMTNEPIALIRTTRINYLSGQAPDDTVLFVDVDEASPDTQPVIQGWSIPGTDGWEVIGVVEKKSGILAKLSDSDSLKKHKMDRAKLRLKRYDDNDRRSKIVFIKIDD